MNYRNRDIEPENTLLDALKQMDKLDKKLLLVIRNEKFISLLSIGDIQRAIIKNKTLDSKVESILRKDIRILKPNDDLETAKKLMMEFRMELCPVVNSDNDIESVYFWEDLFVDKKPKPASQFELPVVIMAGGLGTRLKPLTNVLPKPLIPINEKSIIEEIIERFQQHGCHDFYISVNYKAELIEFYLRQQKLNCDLYFLKEPKPLGTAGSLSLLKDKIDKTFFVSNCDILIEQDYSEIYEYHRTNKNEITIVAALKQYAIQYGTLETGDNGQLLDIIEKPEFVLKINSGMYILEPHVLREVPNDEFFHITHLIENVKRRNGKIGVFPVSEKSWKDLGDKSEFIKNM
ncbi:MAG: NTP transferase domain-containing protein [Bacteroidales bacterium]|nr:NTP transferase domain-containing protein [Bacteroidales bacterium]